MLVKRITEHSKKHCIQLKLEPLLTAAVGNAPTKLDAIASTVLVGEVELGLELDVDLESLLAVVFGGTEEFWSLALSGVEEASPLLPELTPSLCDTESEGEDDGEAAVEVIDGVVGPSRL